MPAAKFVTIDIGRSWTKAFLVSLEKDNKLQVEKSFRQPTSLGDPTITVNFLLSKIAVPQDTPTLVVGTTFMAESVAKNLKATFVKEEDATQTLVSYFKRKEPQVGILDAGAGNFDKRIETAAIGKFLSFPMHEIILENFLGNRSFRPHVLPVDVKELEIEESYLRNLFSEVLKEVNTKEKILLVATGGLLSGTPNIYRLANLIADVLGNKQVAQVFFDREYFLPSFGAMLNSYKQLQMADTGTWLDSLGAFVSLGYPTPIQLNWGYSLLQKVQLTEDELALIPAPADQTIKIEFEDGKEKRSYSVIGGSLGILLDARAKPLLLSYGQPQSRQNISAWLKALEESRAAEEAF